MKNSDAIAQLEFTVTDSFKGNNNRGYALVSIAVLVIELVNYLFTLYSVYPTVISTMINLLATIAFIMIFIKIIRSRSINFFHKQDFYHVINGQIHIYPIKELSLKRRGINYVIKHENKFITRIEKRSKAVQVEKNIRRWK